MQIVDIVDIVYARNHFFLFFGGFFLGNIYNSPYCFYAIFSLEPYYFLMFKMGVEEQVSIELSINQ